MAFIFATRRSAWVVSFCFFSKTVFLAVFGIDSLESKINLWYLDNGILSDDYRTVLKGLKKFVEAERTLGLKIKPTKCEFFPW